ncbi:hypothetical protein Q5M59_08115 [Acinetobacter baumannii]|nr:hypothetical protein [Acinetobacter baumannii]
MSFTEKLSTITIPLSLFIGVFGVFVGLALSKKVNRNKLIKTIKKMDFGQEYLKSVINFWAEQFYWIFGRSYFSKRQFITIPLYTLTISSIFFLIWIIHIYIFNNPEYKFLADFPIGYKLAVKDYYEKGIFGGFLLDFIVIFITKFILRFTEESNYFSLKFVILFLISIIFSYLLFSIIIYIYRVMDMVSLYLDVAPNDPIPVLTYEPIKYLSSSLKLFTQETTIHVTSTGLYTTYFIPEPVLFYCAMTTHAMILLVFITSILSLFLSKLKIFSLFLTKNAGSPQTNAYMIIIFAFLIILSIPIGLIAILVVIA